MRLDKYYMTLDMLRSGASIDEIQEKTDLQSDEILHMQSGERIPKVILFQYKDLYERCPECGRRVLLPCLHCSLKAYKGIKCMDVIKRPLRNHNEPLDAALEYQLLSGER